MTEPEDATSAPQPASNPPPPAPPPPPEAAPPPYGAPPPHYGAAPPAYQGTATGGGSYGGYGYPPVPPGMYHDAEHEVVLPQGVQLASVGRRIGAWFLALPLVLVTLVIGYLVWGLVVWGRGQTPALQVLGMRVYRPETGRVASFWWMALREVPGRIVEGILGFISGLVSFILFVAGKRHQALHDLIAGTVVVHDPNKVLHP